MAGGVIANAGGAQCGEANSTAAVIAPTRTAYVLTATRSR